MTRTAWLAVAALTGAAAFVYPDPTAPQADEHTLLLAHFDEGFDADHAAGEATAQVRGAELVAEGKWGGGVRLEEGQDLSFAAQGNLDMAAGTLMFWFRPDWQPGVPKSHALLSMNLDGDPPGYFVLSQGWWETSGGAGRMYFVWDNQAYMHCNTQVFANMTADELGRWHHLALTWQQGAQGVNAIYLDGERVARTVRPEITVRRPAGRLIVGSDRAQGGGRWAEGLLDELVILDRPLSDAEVAEVFRAQEPDWEAIQARRWAWLTDVLAGPAPELPRAQDGTPLESRTLLDEGSPWTDPARIPEIVARLKRAGFNVYVPCVWHGRGARWPHPTEAKEGALAEQFAALDVDPLAELITQCHAAGIEVHPWFCVVKRERDLHPEFAEEGTPQGFFDAHRPEFRDFIVGLMVDLVRDYEVDGINLDYIRTGGRCSGPLCRAEYRARFATEMDEDAALRTDDGGPNPNLVAWQDEAIAEIVRRVATEGRALRPGLIVSVDGHPHAPGDPPDANGRNDGPWVDAGWVDVVYAMDYSRELAWQRMDAVRAASAHAAAYVTLCGNYERTESGQVVPRDGAHVARLIHYCRRRWPGNGVGLYLWSMLSDEQIDALRAGPFAEDAAPHWVRSSEATN